MNSLAQAKNVISVGASNGNGVAGLSCKGPTNDMLFSKPDVIAPGVDVLSSKAKIESDDPELISFSLNRLSGTSMSTPLTAGIVALLRQYYREGWRFSGIKDCSKGYLPSGQLLKASLINAGVSTSMSPSNTAGYGRINLAGILRFESSKINMIPLFRDYSTYVRDVCNSGSIEVPEYSSLGDDIIEDDMIRETAICAYPGFSLDIKVTLVWYDYPGTASSSGRLNNNLDLTVTDTSSGTVYLGNGGQTFAWDTTKTKYSDRRNSVEQVVITAGVVQTFKPYLVNIKAPKVSMV